MTTGETSTPADPPRRIGVSVVIHAGRVLVGVRGPDGPLPGMAEFPGGKCETGESPEECARRECSEETGLDVATQTRLHDLVWEYAHGRVHLIFVLCRPVRETDVREYQLGFRWVGPYELSKLNFPPANRDVIHRIVDRLLESGAQSIPVHD